MQEAPNGTPSSRVVKASFGDIDEFAQAVRDWDLDYRQLDGGHLEADLQQVSSKNVTITDVHFTRQLLQMGGCPVGVRTFGLLAEGVSELRWCGKRPLDTDILVFPRTDYESVSLLGFRASTLSFPEAHLVGIAETLGLQGVIDSADVAPGKAVACDVRLVAELRGRLNRLSRTLGARPEAAESSAVLYELDFEVPALLLRALASGQARDHPSPAARRAAGIRRAMAFLEEHHHEPVRVRELCQVAGVSSRTLNYAFQERFGVTPKRWVDSFRLHGVRGDLRRAAAGSVVADIANHWGFWHLGKFAADYRRQFGELPSMTLRRAKSRSAAPVARAAAG